MRIGIEVVSMQYNDSMGLREDIQNLRNDIRALRDDQAKILERITNLRIDTAVLKLKTSFLGALFGALSGSAIHWIGKII